VLLTALGPGHEETLPRAMSDYPYGFFVSYILEYTPRTRSSTPWSNGPSEVAVTHAGSKEVATGTRGNPSIHPASAKPSGVSVAL